MECRDADSQKQTPEPAPSAVAEQDVDTWLLSLLGEDKTKKGQEETPIFVNNSYNKDACSATTTSNTPTTSAALQEQDADAWLLSRTSSGIIDYTSTTIQSSGSISTPPFTSSSATSIVSPITQANLTSEVFPVDKFFIGELNQGMQLQVLVGGAQLNYNCNIGARTTPRDSAEELCLTALQRHRKRKRDAELDREKNLEEINNDIKTLETQNQIMKSNINLLDEICGRESYEIINNNLLLIENQKELDEIFEKRKQVQEAKPQKNESQRQRHQREKRKCLNELQEKEINVKRRRVTYLRDEKKNLSSMLDYKKARMIVVHRKTL